MSEIYAGKLLCVGGLCSGEYHLYDPKTYGPIVRFQSAKPRAVTQQFPLGDEEEMESSVEEYRPLSIAKGRGATREQLTTFLVPTSWAGDDQEIISKCFAVAAKSLRETNAK